MKPSTLYKVKSTVVIAGSAAVLYCSLNLYNGNEGFYNKVVMPMVHTLPPETAHNLGIFAAKYRLFARSKFVDPESFRTKVWHLNFSNPVGIAAGFDKQGEVVESLHDMGFGFVEVGSVTPFPQQGNAKPRVFRLEEDQAIINRYGFNSDGHDVVYKRLKALRENDDFKGIIGVNLGKNRDSDDPVNDYVQGIKVFADVADYLVINVSSPNTPGLRAWQRKQHLQQLLTKLVSARNQLPGSAQPPLLLKLAPDLSDEERRDIAEVIQLKKCRVDGLVISNTTVQRNPDLQSINMFEEGGLSGRPLAHPSTVLIADMYRLTGGEIPIIGVGGVFSGQDAYDKICAGASLIQLYTSYVYFGPPRVIRIKQELEDLLRDDNVKTIHEAVGTYFYQ